MRRRGFLGVAAVVLLLPLVLRAEPTTPLRTGLRMPAFEVADQHDKSHRVDESVRLLFFASDMGGNGMMKEALKEFPAGLVQRAGALYVADISRMPSIVTTLFALPAMRRREYPILLDRTGELTRAFPRREGHVTLFHLDRLRITAVEDLDSSARVRAALVLPRDGNATR